MASESWPSAAQPGKCAGLARRIRSISVALISKPAAGPVPRNYRDGGYLADADEVADPRGGRFNYKSPGAHNPNSYDLWSYGEDGERGGVGGAMDIVNWE